MRNSGKLAQAPAGRGNPLYAAETLRDVRNLVPHDRVDHLQPLSRDGLERLAVRHAAGAAPGAVPAPAPVRARQAVAREYEGFFSCLFPCREADTDDTDVPDWRLRGASPRYDASLSWLGKSSMSMEVASSDAVLGPIPGMVSRHR